MADPHVIHAGQKKLDFQPPYEKTISFDASSVDWVAATNNIYVCQLIVGDAGTIRYTTIQGDTVNTTVVAGAVINDIIVSVVAAGTSVSLTTAHGFLYS
jgi:hypothetical protein